MADQLISEIVEAYLLNLTDDEFTEMVNRVTHHRTQDTAPAERPEWEILAEKIERKEAERREWATYVDDPEEGDLANAEYDRLSLEIVELEDQYRRATS